MGSVGRIYNFPLDMEEELRRRLSHSFKIEDDIEEGGVKLFAKDCASAIYVGWVSAKILGIQVLGDPESHPYFNCVCDEVISLGGKEI